MRGKAVSCSHHSMSCRPMPVAQAEVIDCCQRSRPPCILPSWQLSLGRAHGCRGVRLSKGKEGSQPDVYDELLRGLGREQWQAGRGTALKFRWSLACGIPPANSTAMAASRAGRARREAAPAAAAAGPTRRLTSAEAGQPSEAI